MHKLGMRFIGVVKTATRGYPMEPLQNTQFNGRGQWKGLFHEGNGTADDPDLMAFTWVDRERRYFISNTSNLRPAPPIERRRLRQVDQTENASPEHVDLLIRQPNCSALYYDNCAMIDRHNRIRQDDLQIERKFGTHDWSKRVNMTLFSMCVVDAYLLYKQATCVNMTPNEFFWRLATEMVDQPITRRRAQGHRRDEPSASGTSPPSGIGLHITPTKVLVPRKRKHNGEDVTYGGQPVLTQMRRDQHEDAPQHPSVGCC